jgi:type IV secretory pathway TrbF-like protein
MPAIRQRFLSPRGERRSPEAPPPDPREEFLSLWANLGKQRFQLFLLALLSLSSLLFVIVAYVRLAHASKFVPFLYVVDRSGEVLALGSAHPVAADSDTVVYSALETFISSVRAVYRDPLAERAALSRAYAYLPGDNSQATATNYLAAYMATNDPRLLADRFSRTADIVSILRVPPVNGHSAPRTSTWRIRWRETTLPLGTGLAETSEWEAFLTVRIHAKGTIEAFDPNPLGIYIDHLSWSRLSSEHP